MATVKKKKIESVEVDGVKVSISMAVLEDIETVEAMADIQNGNPLAIVPLFRKLFGTDYERIKKELKGDDETLSIEKITQWFTDVIEAINEKN